ncbi:MAG TPA: nuclear transport factor 2 family protein [Myxococcaceae bacterium]|nr:nuclear transport factor 2 family protein [Myxococcaceae bacterium]
MKPRITSSIAIASLALNLGACTIWRRARAEGRRHDKLENSERLGKIMEEVNRTGDFKSLVDALAEDVIFRVTVPDGTPSSGVFRGKESVSTYFTKTLPQLAVFEQQQPIELVPDGDRVIILGDDSYTLHKTGETFRSPYAMVVEFKAERISSILIIQDLSGMARAYQQDTFEGHRPRPEQP